MKEGTVVGLRQPGSFSDDPLTDILRSGARQLLAQAIEAEVGAHIAAHSDLTDGSGRRRVVRHEHSPEREIQTGIGAVRVRSPRARDRDPHAPGGRIRFTSSILPPYLRRAKSVEELLPWLYLKGISTGDFGEALAALAEVAGTRDYCQPEMSETGALHISDGRHPVIERLREGEYIPNSLHLDDAQRQVMVLTGPNMGGKSTYMRQTALICLLAQAGSWVPAASARLPLVDRIFTRVGAHDDLVHGHSTFMVEMLELANILQNATPRSLVLLDEIGRGTSTYDGLAIAWAVAEQLHAGKGVKTMFATHYHQLTDLARLLDRAFNSHMQAREEGNELLLLYRVAEGPADASFGVHVAQMAGVPDAVTARAREVLGKLEQDATVEVSTAGGPVQAVFDLAQAAAAEQKADPLRDEIRKLDLMNMTPLQALEKLHDLQQELL